MILHDYETSSGRNVIKEYIDSLTILKWLMDIVSEKKWRMENSRN